MKVLLIIPSRAAGFSKFPEEVLSIAAMLEKHGHKVLVHDNNVKEKQPHEFSHFNPGIVGFSVATSFTISDATKQSVEFKRLNPNTKIVWGFRHPSALPEQTLQEPFIDYVVVGDGEYTLLELVEYLENGGEESAIKGLAYKSNQRIIINDPRPVILDLDVLPDPAWHLIDINKYWDVSISTSRGCPYSCTFCSDSSFHDRKVGNFSAKRLFEQAKHLQCNYGIKYIVFTGDNFTINKTRLREFCHLVIQNKFQFKWNCQVSDSIEDHDADLMARAGCTSVMLGAESGSQRILDFLNKGKVEEIESTFKVLVKYHIIPTLFIQYGFPTETTEDFLKTLNFIKRLDNPPYLYMKFVPYPRTILFDFCVIHKLITPPTNLAGWSDFPTRCANHINFSEIPNQLMDQAMTSYRTTYATRRFRFMLRHNPRYFIGAMKHPQEFYKSMKDLVKNYLNALLDSSNGKISLVLNLRNHIIRIFNLPIKPKWPMKPKSLDVGVAGST